MFYELLGSLIFQAARSIELTPPSLAETPRGAKDLRRVLLLLSRAGAMWNGMFAALAKENQILSATLAGALSAIDDHLPGTFEFSPLEQEDPLRRHAQLQRRLDECVVVLHAVGHSWTKPVLSELRRGLFDAAEVQRRLVEGAVGATTRGADADAQRPIAEVTS
jgi:hypothetical protein